MTQMLALLLHAALMLAAAPVLAGLLLTQAHPRQAWRDLRRLARKPALWPQQAALPGAVPVACLGASLAAALLVPSFALGMASAPLADLVLLAGLFGIARAAMVLAGFEAGAGIAGLAGQRAGLLRLVADPALLVALLVLAAAAGSSNLDAASAALRETGLPLSLLPAAVAALLALLAGLDRTGEVAGAFAGGELAVLTFAAQLRLLTVLSLLAALLLPFGLAPAGSGPDAWVIGAACWAVKMAALGAAASGLGRLRARLRPDRAPELALLGLLLALLAAALFFAGQAPA